MKTGPIDETKWADKLRGRVTKRGGLPTLRGYEVSTDLALFYRFSDLIYLHSTGELPRDENISRAFEIFLVLSAPCDIGEMPAHAASLVRLCDGTETAAAGVAASTLAEHVGATLARKDELFAWLQEPVGAPPSAFLAGDEGCSLLRALRSAMDHSGHESRFLETVASHQWTTDAAAIVALHALGVTQADGMLRALLAAKLPTVLDEAWSVTPRDFQNYAMRVPDYQYEDSQ